MEIRRYAAPVAFLLAATVAVVLIRSGLHSGGDGSAGAHTSPAITRAVSTARAPVHPRSHRRFWTVRAGDTLGSIAARAHVTLANLRRLNPKVSPTSLYIGEKIRLE